MMKSLLLSLTLFLMPIQMAAAKDLALIIGIDEYENLPDLNKAVEDATGYRELFTSKGFDVHYLENPDGGNLRVELAQFYNLIEQGDTVVFVYSGHGWSDGVLNYLVPADTPDIESTMVAAELSIPLKNGVNGIIDRISNQGAQLTVAIVDACRNIPFSGHETRALGIVGGLAPVEPPSGTFIVYSAASNQTALDRLGESDALQYSVFTRFFLPNLRDSGDLRQAIVETRGQVRAAADIINHNQRPAYYDELTGSSCLFGDCVAEPSLDGAGQSQAAITWDLIKDTTDPIVLTSFIERFDITNPELTAMARDILVTEAEQLAEIAELRATQNAVAEKPIQSESSQAAFEEAQWRISVSNGSTLSLAGLSDLVEIPPQIKSLSNLTELDLNHTSVRDLLPLTNLNFLTNLNLSNTPINNVDILGQLITLETLDISGTMVSDISALYTLPYLEEPEMAETPLSDLRNLSWQNIEQGDFYMYGEDADYDPDAAFPYFHQAYAQYDWEGGAAHVLGLMYWAGDGVEKDFVRAVDYFRIATQRYHHDAAFDLALMYEFGEGIDESYAEAVRYQILSLELGSDLAILRTKGKVEGLEPFPAPIAIGIQSALRQRGLYDGDLDGNLGPKSLRSMAVLCHCD